MDEENIANCLGEKKILYQQENPSNHKRDLSMVKLNAIKYLLRDHSPDLASFGFMFPNFKQLLSDSYSRV